ncbi:MAG TPA: PIG-L deacetylase family protein [Armatimonadota bacterium]|nr:PIG-L deacetylase family protein [Armatimonadota bacterium]
MSSVDGRLTILAVVAHPHDISHMCGTLAHHIADGDAVVAVAVTGGLTTHRERLYDELRKPPAERDPRIINQTDAAYGEQKAHEMAQACALFGITDVRVLPFEDKPLEITPAVVDVLTEIIYEVRPHLVLTHAPRGRQRHGMVDIAPEDHRDTGVAVTRAVRMANQPNAETGRTPHHVTSVYYTGVDLPLTEADLLVDITDQAANRMKAEILFASQAQTPAFARKRTTIGAGTAGWHAQTGYAEPWIRAAAQVGRRLPVTREELDNAEMSRQDCLARMSKLVSDEEAE